MPSLFHLMVGLGGTALAVGATVLWLHEPQQAPPHVTRYVHLFISNGGKKCIEPWRAFAYEQPD